MRRKKQTRGELCLWRMVASMGTGSKQSVIHEVFLVWFFKMHRAAWDIRIWAGEAWQMVKTEGGREGGESIQSVSDGLTDSCSPAWLVMLTLKCVSADSHREARSLRADSMAFLSLGSHSLPCPSHPQGKMRNEGKERLSLPGARGSSLWLKDRFKTYTTSEQSKLPRIFVLLIFK